LCFSPCGWAAMIDLTDNERLALAVELRRITDDDHSPGSFRTRTLKGILDKLALPLPRPPLPPPKPPYSVSTHWTLVARIASSK
jgi:hypothetical protein